MHSFGSRLSPARATQIATIALRGIQQEYPNSPSHLLLDAHDRRSPRELHPAFFGCLDWHSAVHSHWLLCCLLRALPSHPLAPTIRRALGEQLSAANLAAEAAYFAEPGRSSFERPYGWAWLLKLAHELHSWADSDAQSWLAALQPLAALIVERYLGYLPRLTYPLRSGAHSNTAFGLTFALDYALATGNEPLRAMIAQRSLDYYANDAGCPIAWGPGGGDFLSPCLSEADLMRRVLAPGNFAIWLDRFLPQLADDTAMLLSPALVSDRSDGHIVHLDGLNMSRAWAMWGIAAALPPADRRVAALRIMAEQHAEAGLSGLASGDYMGEHWLGSFALYMISCAKEQSG
jgi:hypothetical protein